VVILADTSVWVRHLRRGDVGRQAPLGKRELVIHPLVIGELVCGELPERTATLHLLASALLSQAQLWTLDRRLTAVATRLHVNWQA